MAVPLYDLDDPMTHPSGPLSSSEKSIDLGQGHIPEEGGGAFLRIQSSHHN